MAAEPVLSWNAHILVAGESSAFGTTPDPAGSQAMEFVTCNLGPAELGQIRPRRDRETGRGMVASYVEGRVQPIPWSIETSVKSRSAIDAQPKELALYVGAGLYAAGNASTSYTLTANNDPIAATAFQGVSIRRALGERLSTVYEAEQLRGGIVKTLTWSGGDKEATLVAAGVGQGKYHLGYAASITVANNSTTTLTFASVEESYRFAPGYYQLENEIINILSVDYSAGTASMQRGTLGSTAAAHTAAALMPYMPAPSVSGSPISEGTTVTCTLDSQTLRVLNWQVIFNSGMDASPGESGSKYFQSVIQKRYSSQVKLRVLLRREGVSMLGKATQKKTPLALTLVQGSATGAVMTFTWSNMEIDPFVVPDTANDAAIIDLSLRNFGSEFLLTLT